MPRCVVTTLGTATDTGIAGLTLIAAVSYLDAQGAVGRVKREATTYRNRPAEYAYLGGTQ